MCCRCSSCRAAATARKWALPLPTSRGASSRGRTASPRQPLPAPSCSLPPYADGRLQVLALLRCRMPQLPTNCSVFEGAPVTAADKSCWLKFARYHKAVGCALLSAAHAREAAHHLSSAALALASTTALSTAGDWEESRQLALLLAACSALVPQLPLSVDRLLQLAVRLGMSPSHPLPPLKRSLCDPLQPPSSARLQPVFSPFVAAAAMQQHGARVEEWSAFIEFAGRDAAVELLTAASTGGGGNRGSRLLRVQRLLAWMRDNGVVMSVMI